MSSEKSSKFTTISLAAVQREHAVNKFFPYKFWLQLIWQGKH